MGYRVETVDTGDCEEVVPGWTHLRLDVCDLDIEDSYDMAVSISTIEHLGLGHYEDPVNPVGDREAVERLAQALRIGGRLFATVPFAAVPTTTWQKSYDLASLRKLFEGNFTFQLDVYVFSGLRWRRAHSNLTNRGRTRKTSADVVRQVALVEAAKIPNARDPRDRLADILERHQVVK